MFTSYFAKSAEASNTVAICAKVPDWYKGPHYRQVAPSYSIFAEYKKTGDSDLYTGRFYAEVLHKLNASEVYHDLWRLADDPILLCYEKPSEFCHRHLVANWLTEELGIIINELESRKGFGL